MLGSLIKIAESVADKLFPGPEQEIQRTDLQGKLQLAMLEQAGTIQKAAADVIESEATGHSWLQRNWRPITMLTFVGLIFARWVGWGADNMSEAEVLEVFSLIKIGLGGYIVGRSAEKIVKMRNGK